MKKVLLTIIIALISMHFANAQNYTMYSNIQYDTLNGVDPNLLSLDVYKPTLYSGKRPVMIYIHGGYWKAGDKSAVGSKAKIFTDSGYVFVSINYRLSPDPFDTLSTTAVRFPIHPQNCAKAVDWVFNNIEAYAGDTSKVSLIGHSAGAHLALLLSTNETFLQNEGISLNRIKCTCSLDAGVFDLIEELQQAGNNLSRRIPLLNAFGNDPALYDDASPQYNIQAGKDIPWMYLVHQNTADRVYGNNRFKDSLVANGFSNVSLFNADPYDHETINIALGHPLDSIGETQSVMQFFSNCLINNPITGIDDFEIEKVTIYPNPAIDFIYVSGLDEGFNGTIFIFNLMGEMLFFEQKTGSQFSIETGNLNSGIYFIQIKNENGEIITRKFIKK